MPSVNATLVLWPANMTVKFVIQQKLPASVEQFWAEIFRSEEFNRALYVDLGCRYELELWDPVTGERRARVWPSSSLPGALGALIGGDVSLLEEGNYEHDAERYDFRIISSKLSKRIRIEGSLSVRHVCDRTCERNLTFEIEARLPGVSRVIETVLEGVIRREYEKNATFIKAYLA